MGHKKHEWKQSWLHFLKFHTLCKLRTCTITSVMLDKQLNKCMCSAIKYLKVSVWRSDWPQQVLVSSFIIYYLEDISCPLAYLRVYYIKMSKYLTPVSASGYCVTNPPADVNIHWLQHKIESVNACIALIHDSCQHFFHGLFLRSWIDASSPSSVLILPPYGYKWNCVLCMCHSLCKRWIQPEAWK